MEVREVSPGQLRWVDKMPTRIDMTGEVFGKWKVLSFSHLVRADKYWNCLCECGRSKTVSGSSLRRGSSLSCGECTPKYKDLTGQVFSYLIVLSLSRVDKQRSYWTCRCTCGNLIETQAASLVQGGTTSCGCKKGEKRLNDISGQVFGRLTALYLWSTRPVVWLFLCDCGTAILRKPGPIVHEGTGSCGCHKIEVGKANMEVLLAKQKIEREIKHKDPSTPANLNRFARTCEKSPLWRQEVYQRDSYTCQDCGDARGGNLHAHHIVHLADLLVGLKTPEEVLESSKVWDVSNGVTLCNDYHAKRHENLKFLATPIKVGV